MVKRVKRERVAQPEESTTSLRERFVAVLREDPWYDALPNEVLSWRLDNNTLYRAVWLAQERYKIDVQYVDRNNPGEYCEANAGFKKGTGPTPIIAVVNCYLEVRKGLPTITELRDKDTPRIRRKRP